MTNVHEVKSVRVQAPLALNSYAKPTRNRMRPKPVNRLNDLEAKEWIPETVSVWVQRGLGKGHEHAQIERQHPAPFSFQDVRASDQILHQKRRDGP